MFSPFLTCKSQKAFLETANWQVNNTRGSHLVDVLVSSIIYFVLIFSQDIASLTRQVTQLQEVLFLVDYYFKTLFNITSILN